MAEKKKRGEFTLSDKEYASREMMLIAYTMLESRGYSGFTELAAMLQDSEIMLRLIRFLNGTTLRLPPLSEFNKCLKAAIYTFCDMHKMVNFSLCAKGKDIRQFMDITQAEEKELLDIFDEWVAYMHKQGVDTTKLMHCNRGNTIKRMKMCQRGKKWTGTKY